MSASPENDTFVEEGGEGLKGWRDGPTEYITMGMQGVLCLVGLTGNSLVLFIFGKRGERLTYVIAIITLAGKDLIACSLLLPLCIAFEALHFHTFSNFTCKSYHFIGHVTYLFGVQFLVLIALDRCACVCVGHTQATYHRRAFIAVGIVSLCSVSSAVVPTLAYAAHDGLCMFRPEIIPVESMVAFYRFSLSVFIISAAIWTISYATVFAVTLYRKYTSKQLLQDSSLGDLDGMAGTESGSSNAGDLATRDSPERSPAAEERRQLLRLQQEQISVTIVMFTVTLVLLILYIPAFLSAFGHIKPNLLLFELHQISFVSNFFVYLCLEEKFRKEVKELFQSSWSRLRSMG